MRPDLQRLREQISKALPPSRFDGNATICACDECKELQEALRHKSWDEVPNEFIDLTCSPMLLEPAANAEWFPPFVSASLETVMAVTRSDSINRAAAQHN